MKLFEDLAAVLLDPSENVTRFVAHCNALLVRALRIPHQSHMKKSIQTHALALCVCSHLCGVSIESVHQARCAMSRQSQSEEGHSVSQEQLSLVWETEWKHAVKELGLEKSDRTEKAVMTRPLFDDYNLFFVPSLLFSATCARLLLKRFQEKGGNGQVCSAGENGFKEAKIVLSRGDSSCRNSLVCADVNLINKYSKVYNVHTRPPKWVRDSLRDSRIKDVALYVKQDNPLNEPTTPDKALSTTKRIQCEVNSGTALKVSGTSPKRRRTFYLSAAEGKSGITSENQNASDILLNGGVLQKPADISKVPNESTVLKQREDTSLKKHEPSSHEASPNKQTKSSWACEVRTSFSGGDFPMNEKICELLGVVQETCIAKKDHFRAIGYQRAIARISALQHEITTVGDVRELSSGKGIGERMETKVIEIITTGRLLQAEAVLENAENIAVKELCKVWGIGPVKALNLSSHGIKSIAELRDAAKINNSILDRNQKIGLRHCEDLLLRIPRKNVAELESFVRMVVKSVDHSLEITVAGSYLRGKKDCGDVDIMVCGSRERLRFGFPKIIEVMRKKGVLTDDLIVGDVKYFGIFRFPGRPHARVDLFAVPNEQYPFALLTYTGSAIFNRLVCLLSPLKNF